MEQPTVEDTLRTDSEVDNMFEPLIGETQLLTQSLTPKPTETPPPEQSPRIKVPIVIQKIKPVTIDKLKKILPDLSEADMTAVNSYCQAAKLDIAIRETENGTRVVGTLADIQKALQTVDPVPLRTKRRNGPTLAQQGNCFT